MTDPKDKAMWYRMHREKVDEVFLRSFPEKVTTHTSPSGRYRLDVVVHSTGPDTWSFSRGHVLALPIERPIATVDRNFGAFPFAWFENHPVGHDYLLCGEDYQGQTVVELDTGRRVDHLEDGAEHGMGFCWAAHYPSSHGELLFVEGCFWAAPYELVLYDFTNPMQLPYPELMRWPVRCVEGFRPDGSFLFDYDEQVRRTDGKPFDEHTSAELRDLLKDGSRLDEHFASRRCRVVWRALGDQEVTAIEPSADTDL